MKGRFVSIGASMAALGVVLGAFGAHALRGRIDDRGVGLWETATRYWFIGAFGVLLYGLFRKQTQGGTLAGWLLLCGSVLFAGSLYGLALGAPRALGAVTPFGGVSLIAGFVRFALSARQS